MDPNRVIGLDNQMPWHLPQDLKHFRAITMGHPILMGRRTYESIGHPLPGRKNIVLSRNPDYAPQGCETARSLDEAKALARPAETLFVIGGSELYRLCLPLASIFYLTQIHKSFKGDTFFPEWERADWKEVAREDQQGNQPDDFNFSFLTLERMNHSFLSEA